jgi:hypothetical protein
MKTFKKMVMASLALAAVAGGHVRAGQGPATFDRANPFSARQAAAYNLEIGPFATRAAADAQRAELEAHGIRCYILEVGGVFFVRTY